MARFQTAILKTLAALGLPILGLGQTQTTFSFEQNMEGWESDAAMPNAPCFVTSNFAYPQCQQPSTPVDRLAAIQRTSDTAYEGSHSLRFTMDGTLDEGTAWVIRPFAVSPGGRYRVHLQFYLSPPRVPWPNIVYAGSTRPRGLLHAPGPPQSDFSPCCPGYTPTNVAGWGQYSYLAEVTADDSGTVWVALGFWADYEGNQSYYIDNITVAIDPISQLNTTAALGMSPDTGNSSLPPSMFVFSDSNGWQDLGVVNILINNYLSPLNACYLAYVPKIDVLYLVNDAGTALLPGTTVLNNAATLRNSQCTVHPSGVLYGANGESLTLLLDLTFSSTFSGTQTFFVAARDIAGGNNTGWQTAGTWTKP
jgi:hypothetical protein